MNGVSPAQPDAARSEAMMEGTRMLIDSLREKVASLEDRCEKMDREKVTLRIHQCILSTLSTFTIMPTCMSTLIQLTSELFCFDYTYLVVHFVCNVLYNNFTLHSASK